MICKVSIGGYVLGMYFEIQSGFELAVYTVYPLLPCQKKNMHGFIIPGSHRYHGIYMKYQKMNRHMTSICQRNCSKLKLLIFGIHRIHQLNSKVQLDVSSKNQTPN